MENKFKYGIDLELSIEYGWGEREIEDGFFIIETDHKIDDKQLELYADMADTQLTAKKMIEEGKRVTECRIDDKFPFRYGDGYMIDRLVDGIAYYCKGKAVSYDDAEYPVTLDGVIVYHHIHEEETV